MTTTTFDRLGRGDVFLVGDEKFLAVYNADWYINISGEELNCVRLPDGRMCYFPDDQPVIRLGKME